MTVNEIIADLDNHGFTDTSSATKVAIINDVVWDIDSRERWPYLEADADLSFSAGSATPTSPPDFSTVLSLVNPDTGLVLLPERWDVVRKKYAGELTRQGEPFLYYFIKKTLYVYPIPSSNTTLKLSYLATQSELSVSSGENDILLPARHHRVIVLGALARLYAQEDDLQMASYFSDLYESRIENMRSEIWQRQVDRPDRIYLLDDEDEVYGDW